MKNKEKKRKVFKIFLNKDEKKATKNIKMQIFFISKNKSVYFMTGPSLNTA